MTQELAFWFGVFVGLWAGAVVGIVIYLMPRRPVCTSEDRSHSWGKWSRINLRDEGPSKNYYQRSCETCGWQEYRT